MESGTSPIVERCYAFVRSILNPDTGLAAGDNSEASTTLARNALAALLLIHEKDLESAWRIFVTFDSFFQVQGPFFHGFPHIWNASTGLPDISSLAWDSEAALLLIALEYYHHQSRGRSDNAALEKMASGIAEYLWRRISENEQIIADEIPVVYAALHPRALEPTTQEMIDKLHGRFLSLGSVSSADRKNVLSHIVLGALVFGESPCAPEVGRFARSEALAVDDNIVVSAYCAYAGDHWINVEASAQLLLAYAVCGRAVEAVRLRSELLKVIVCGRGNREVAGLPQLVAAGKSSYQAVAPAFEPTCFLLFSQWGFNPYWPNRNPAIS